MLAQDVVIKLLYKDADGNLKPSDTPLIKGHSFTYTKEKKEFDATQFGDTDSVVIVGKQSNDTFEISAYEEHPLINYLWDNTIPVCLETYEDGLDYPASSVIFGYLKERSVSAQVDSLMDFKYVFKKANITI